MSEAAIVVCPDCGAPNRVPAERLGANPSCGKCKARLFQGEPLAAGLAMFDRQIGKGTLPVLVDFWAEWCGPCKMMAPEFAKAAKVLEPHYRLLKVDTEAVPELLARYQIRSIPTLAVFKGGREIARQSGAIPASAIVDWARSAV